MEAAACGTATVASDAPGLRDAVVHQRTGWLVPHGDVAALADRLAALFARPKERDRLGGEARRFAEGFSWDASARGVLDVLGRVVAAPHSGLQSTPARPRAAATTGREERR